MKLLLRREQKSVSGFSLVPLRIGSGSIFSLSAELEFDAEELQLIEKYQFNHSPIVRSDFFDDLKKAVPHAMIVGLVALAFLWMMVGFFTALPFSLIITCVMIAIYFKTERQQILVSDLMNGGRKFRCDSVVDLVHQEAFLEGVSQYLRQLIETAKHWDDREVIPIKPLDKAAAKRALLMAF